MDVFVFSHLISRKNTESVFFILSKNLFLLVSHLRFIKIFRRENPEISKDKNKDKKYYNNKV